MIFMIDGEGRIRRCNEALIRFLGLSYLDVLGKNWQKVLFKKEPADHEPGSTEYPGLP